MSEFSPKLQSFLDKICEEQDPYMVWHDGPDFSALYYVKDLSEEEKSQAEDFLIEKLSHEFDERWLEFLIQSQSSKALPLLRDRLAQSPATFQIRLARAIDRITGTDDNTGVLVAILRDDPSPYTRLEAAMALKNYSSPEVIDALFQAVEDPDYLVRYHASNSLLAIHGLNTEIYQLKDIFANIIEKQDGKKAESASAGGHIPVSLSEQELDKERYKRAAGQLKDLFQNKAEKRKPSKR